MAQIKKFNESSNAIPTWRTLLNMVENGEVSLVNISMKNFKEHLNEFERFSSSRGGSFMDQPIASDTGWGSITNGISNNDESIVVVYDDNNVPIVIIRENELTNPFVFGDVVICPGHDSITCYNKQTRTHKTKFIR